MMIRLHIQEYIFSLGIFFALTSGCTCCSPTQERPIVPHLAKTSQEPINRIELYLENSASMGGYFRFKTRFNDHLDDLVTDLMKYKGDSLQVFTIAEKTESYISAMVFRDELNPTNPKKIAIAKSSPLDSILYKIASSWEPGVVSILVTDGIISGTTKQIEANREYNKDNRNALKNNLKIMLGSFADDISIKIMAFKSEFQATSGTPYFRYDNSKISNQFFENRPYYVFILGNSGQIRELERELSRTISSQYSLEFGFNDHNLVNSQTTSVSKDRQGVTLTGERIKLDPNSNSYVFAVVADFKMLPSEYKSLDFLSRNAKILVNGAELSSSSVQVCHLLDGGCDNLVHSPSSQRTVDALSGFTHLLQVRLDEYKYKSGDIVELIVDKDIDSWYKSWSSDSDHDIQTSDSTTFAFSTLVQGIIESYKESSPILRHEILISQN
jgi:hypothetical protein